MSIFYIVNWFKKKFIISGVCLQADCPPWNIATFVTERLRRWCKSLPRLERPWGEVSP